MTELQSIGGFPCSKPKQTATPSGYVPPHPTFLNQYGLPTNRFICSKRLLMWPDELEKAASIGAEWLGRRAQVQMLSDSGTPVMLPIRVARYEYVCALMLRSRIV